MMTSSSHDQVMQIQKILIVLGEEDITMVDGIRQMLSV